MKKKIVLSVGIVALLAFVYSFSFAPVDVKKTNEEIQVDPFTSIHVSIPAKVYVETGNQHSLKIETSEANLEKIKTEVKDDGLYIGCKEKKCNIKGDVVIHIITKELSGVSVAGSCDVIAEKPVNSDDLILKIAGSGDIKFAELQADKVGVKISGSGNVSLSGNGDELGIAIAGSGKINAESFEVDKADIKVSGSGNCKVFASDDLSATIAGSGNVVYKGSPKVNTVISGSGKVKRME
jgi:hypothetical protein